MRSVVMGGLVALAVAGATGVAANADETVAVSGTSFPTGSTRLTYFGCADLYHADTRGPEVLVTRDDASPAGRRALHLGLPGTGTAAGPVSRVDSVATSVSRLSVDTAAGSTGVAYVWYVTPGLEPGEVWAGRADLATGAGWQQVDAATATYAWTRLDAETGEVLEDPGEASIPEFTGDHGDGPGYLLSGFGCDGAAFDLDRIQVGAPGSVTTYDLEGWRVSTSITFSDTRVAPGTEVEISGTSSDPWARVMGAPMVLEARPQGATSFEPVSDALSAGGDGRVTATVTPTVTTEYRWRFLETAYADARVSPVGKVVVQRAAETPSATDGPSVVRPPDEQASAEPSDPGGSGGSAGDAPTPAVPPAPEPTGAAATEAATPAPEPSPTPEPTATTDPTGTADPTAAP